MTIGLVDRIDDYLNARIEMEFLAEAELESRIMTGRPDAKLWERTCNAVASCQRAANRLQKTVRRLERRDLLGN